MNRCYFPLIIIVPGDPVAPGDFESPVIRDREISLWRSEGGDLGGGAGGVWRRGRARGREREVGRSGAEVGRGGHESGDERRARRRLCVTKPQFLRPGKNPKASLIFGEKSAV